ncbi:hypothetical protein [Embleya sp. MST-111070]|uniref:hypothetical protein n=1 Tax=Embleya sp. MST-111070 TaxID=3398231 RepID=UPI003F741568
MAGAPEDGDADGTASARLSAARGTVLKGDAYPLCGDASLAEDLVQEAPARALGTRRARSVEHPESYVRTAIPNPVMDGTRLSARRLRVRPLFVMPTEPTGEGRSPRRPARWPCARTTSRERVDAGRGGGDPDGLRGGRDDGGIQAPLITFDLDFESEAVQRMCHIGPEVPVMRDGIVVAGRLPEACAAAPRRRRLGGQHSRHAARSPAEPRLVVRRSDVVRDSRKTRRDFSDSPR